MANRALLIATLGASWVLSLICIRAAVRSGASRPQKVLWSIVSLIPIAGPAFFAIGFNPPSVQPESLKGRTDYGGF